MKASLISTSLITLLLSSTAQGGMFTGSAKVQLRWYDVFASKHITNAFVQYAIHFDLETEVFTVNNFELLSLDDYSTPVWGFAAEAHALEPVDEVISVTNQSITDYDGVARDFRWTYLKLPNYSQTHTTNWFNLVIGPVLDVDVGLPADQDVDQDIELRAFAIIVPEPTLPVSYALLSGAFCLAGSRTRRRL